MVEKPLLEYSTTHCTGKKLWRLHFPVLAGWFLTLGLEIGEEKKHGFSGTLPKIGTGVQSAVCRTKLITITLHSHQGLTAPTQRGGKTDITRGTCEQKTNHYRASHPSLLAMLYPSIPPSARHRKTLFLSDTELEHQGEVHWHFLSSHTQTPSP